MRLFAPDEAIHFVATRMESEESGAKLKFVGGVRGWQGERNLAAEEILVDQRTHGLEARTRVASRIPRQTDSAAVSESDYVQISAELLTYDEGAGLAVYSGNVRLVLVEGWLEAERVEIEMGRTGGNRIQSMQASDGVRLEFTRTTESDLSDPISGTADRVTYDPMTEIVRLFGDRAPAAIRHTGEGGGTTTGRVLAYRLDLGTLDVDSGDQGSASIRTSGGS
jgi:lipopolysaccharide transport protein LptA